MTHEEVSKLTDEEIRIKVAELCGYHIYVENKEGWAFLCAPNGDRLSDSYHPACRTTMWLKFVPNYPQDLNACHAMEKCLTDEQWGKYTAHLLDIVSEHIDKENARLRSVCYCSATARRRCNAFVMTMTEENP